MNYNEFTEEVKRGVEKIVKTRLGDGIAVIRNVIKNNSVEMKAISITRKGENATPTIYLNNYYKEYNNGKSIDEISKEIFGMYIHGKNNFDFNVDDFSEFEKIKGKIFYRIVNYELNKKMLSDMPYFKFLDLAIVFFVMISCDEQGMASALIHNQHIENWNISPDELREIAYKNTWEEYPAVIKRMEDVISEMIIADISCDIEKTDVVKEDLKYGEYNYEEVESVIREEVENLKADKDMDMFVLTNSIRINGATCITYPDVLKKFAEEKESDIYIIPSSIHEVILIVGTDWPKEKIDNMIVEVNESELDPIEILSNHVYIYRREDDEIYM